MAHIPQSPVSADKRLLDVVVEPAIQGDHLERLEEQTRTAYPERRSCLEGTIAVVAQSRQIRSMTLKTVEQGGCSQRRIAWTRKDAHWLNCIFCRIASLSGASGK
jgi:hypothetical protein